METPKTNEALQMIIDAGGVISQEHQCLVKLARDLEVGDAMQNQWLLDDKTVLEEALREIYSIRGEDPEIERIVNTALRKANAEGI